MAECVDVSKNTVQRVWQAHGLKPHLVKTFKLSNDEQFVEKIRDVVGLYMSPPENALVLCIDEKNKIQALDRTQPGLPLKKGYCEMMTHDYKRKRTGKKQPMIISSTITKSRNLSNERNMQMKL